MFRDGRITKLALDPTELAALRTMMLALRLIPTAVIVTTMSWPSVAAQARPVAPPQIGYNALEYAYVWMAASLASDDAGHRHYPVPSTLPAAISMCEKIAPDAIYFSTAFFGLEAWSYGYLASKCFMQVAKTVKDITLCDRVRVPPGPPPRRFLAPDKNRPITPEECRASVRSPGYGGGSGWYDFDTIVALLGYTREDIIAKSGGRSPEEGGAMDLMLNVLPIPSDDEADYHTIWNDHLVRLARLPDFSRGDAAARRQLDRLAPGWSSPANASPLATTLRCSVERPLPGNHSGC